MSLSTSEVELAHILFIDIVGYSASLMELQRRLLMELEERVRASVERCRMDAPNDLLILPTGDGMALVFFGDPANPVQCALHISLALQSRSYLQVRMGLHSGAVYRIEDINTRANVAGDGINIARHVMDRGDAGHILLSEAIVEMLGGARSWQKNLLDLGYVDVKHGMAVRLFSLFAEGAGNREWPSKVPRTDAGPGTPDGPRVAILYRRSAQPDEHLVELLEKELPGRGYEVFIDRHLSVGVDWAREIESQVRNAYAVVPLLSAASVQSEMLAYEIQTAHEEAGRRGKPRLLPIRVAYTDPLPQAMEPILGPLKYALWNSPEDDGPVVEELVWALEHEPEPEPPRGPELLPVPSGVLSLDSPVYVQRPTDREFLAALTRRDSIVRIKGARQMGKTSLLARGLQEARERGARVISTDFQAFSAEHLKSADTFLQVLAHSIAKELHLSVSVKDFWDPYQGPNGNFREFMLEEVLARRPEPVVWGLDEVDRLFSTGFSSEVFGLFRSWHNERALHPNLPWTRLTLAMSYASEAHLLIPDVNQSPFNVGTRVMLEDFTREQVAELNRRYGSPLAGEGEVARYHELLGGQPYLTNRGLHKMATDRLDLAAFEAQADQESGLFGDHLRRILMLLAQDPKLQEAMREAVHGRARLSAETFYQLWSAGILSGDSAESAHPRCELYARYLRRHLG
jgi:class 3 adenylate cyclase